MEENDKDQKVVQVLSAKEVTSSLWSRNAKEKCRLGITDSVSYSIDSRVLLFNSFFFFLSRSFMTEVWLRGGTLLVKAVKFSKNELWTEAACETGGYVLQSKMGVMSSRSYASEEIC